ncbi:MAG: hypothetical protein SPF69_05000 [Candidatus Ornithospirochaeta sp.]|nr:hypothetical protein [Sphaerochaetaceae bacterium]MDY5523431.1 hypothetical protein [Candidatus Ornithospirochaeta sp.]
MSRRRELFLVISMLVLSFIPFSVSLYLGRMERVSIILPLSALVLSFSLIALKRGKALISLVLYLVDLILVASASLSTSISVHGAKGSDTIVFVIYTLVPYFSLIPLYICRKRKGWISLTLGALISLSLLFVTSSYLNRYSFLYELNGNYSLYSELGKYSFLFLAVGVLSLLFFKTDRNYLNYVMLLLSIVLLALMESYRIGEGLLLSFLSSSRIMILTLVLLVYVISEKKVIRKSERRNIVFKDMVYEEVKPLKKRPRKPKFEVPPNVPVFRVNSTQKHEDDSVNNEQIDG